MTHTTETVSILTQPKRYLALLGAHGIRELDARTLRGRRVPRLATPDRACAAGRAATRAALCRPFGALRFALGL